MHSVNSHNFMTELTLSFFKVVTINSITNTDGESLQGGELTVRLSLEPNPASGVETFEIKPATSTSIYDGGGTPMADTTNTGEITLNGVAVTIIDAILEDDNSYITITLMIPFIQIKLQLHL